MFDILKNINSVTVAAANGGFNWYGFIIGTGMIICIVIAYFMAKKRGYYSDLVFDISICCIPCAIVGARLYFLIFDLIENPNRHWTFAEIIGLNGGLAGLAIYGGLIGACLGSLIVLALQKKKKDYEKVNFMQMADLAFTVIILGQVIGRWGNFANQEAYGNPVTNPSLQWFPYAVHIDAAHSITGSAGWFQATFFYESLWNLIGFGLLMWFYNGKRKSFDGFILSSYCIWYGFGRFFIEGIRTDSLWLVPNVIRVSQVVSVIIFIFGIAYIVAHVYRARAAGKKPFLFVNEADLNADYFGYEKSILYRRTLKPDEEPEEEDDELADLPPEERYWEQGDDYVEDEDLTEKYFGSSEEPSVDSSEEQPNEEKEDYSEDEHEE